MGVGAEDVEEEGGMRVGGWKRGEFDELLVPVFWVERRVARREKLCEAG
jgi:hypothetical protein